MPSLNVSIVPLAHVKWGVRIVVFDHVFWDVFVADRRYWLTTETGQVLDTRVPLDTGMQAISAYVASMFLNAAYLVFGADTHGRVRFPKRLDHLQITAGEAYSLLFLLANRQIPFTDNADEFAWTQIAAIDEKLKQAPFRGRADAN